MEDKEKGLANEILAENMSNLIAEYSTLENNEEKGKILQEKLETLAEVKEQVNLGNEDFINKVIEKRIRGIL